ncbi:uncharacterized protein LOC111291122 [Durio zibethinus]|uniref:Uncharacterized protein LOC111291122 n=1 Tax=Durio zibethinus TaxID=66656 RepID=A0A6P5YD90_DURZI|nr:uncharacterized protein LOC111291122 [Durio zibethinus]
MAALRFKTFLLVSLLLLLITPFSHGMVEGGMQAKYSSLERGGKGMIQMRSSRKLLMGAMLDYDDTGANPKHDPRKKPGKP